MTLDGYRQEATLLVVEGITRAYGGVVAVDNVDLVVGQSECVGVIGPNGAGKTTLFNGVSGFDRRRGDRVTFAGKNVAHLPPSKRAKLGLVRTFQGAHVFPALTVDQHMWLAEHALGDGAACEDAAVARDLAGTLGLGRYGQYRATDLPYGITKCLGIVLAVSTGARLLMLDEPAAGLGEDEAAHIEAAIGHVRRLAVAVLVIDHHLSFLTRVCDRLIVMDFGRKIADGKPEDVLADAAVRSAYIGA